MDRKYDTLVYEQCNQQNGFVDDNATIFTKSCTGPIYHPLQCCFCYKIIEPTFINEEIVRVQNINYNNNKNNKNQFYLQFQSNWEYH